MCPKRVITLILMVIYWNVPKARPFFHYPRECGTNPEG